MLDIEEFCDCGVCDICISNSDWDCYDPFDEPSEYEISVAEHNYECMIYREPERRIWV